MRHLDEFDPRHNCLNGLRLLFAALVIVSHAWPLGGFGDDPVIGRVHLGTFAVYGFFAISGFLVTRSRCGSSSGIRYLWARMLRILPGYWMCLLAVAFVFAPLSVIRGGQYHMGAAGHYFVANLALLQRTSDIPGTLRAVPYSGYWDGSLWSLAYEFICYCAVAALAAIGWLRRRPVTWIGAACAATLIVVPAHLLGSVSVSVIGMQNLLSVGAPFAAGAVLYMWSDRVPLHWPLGIASAALTFGLMYAPVDPTPFIALPLAYLCLWIGATVPLRHFRRNDLSYGVYVYAFPVQQLFALYGLNQWGVLAYLTITVIPVAGLAALSWFFVERPALHLKSRDPGARRRLMAERQAAARAA